MAAITLQSNGASFMKKNEDIDDAETDTWWLSTPKWARYAQVFFSLETDGGSVQLSFVTVPPFDRDDDHIMLLKEQAALTAMTAADVTHIIDIGPGILAGTDDVTVSATADSYAAIHCVLPDILGVRILASGANNGYDLSVTFRP